MAVRKKELLPPALSTAPIIRSAETISPPEEPKFYGEGFISLMATYRKGGTLRERNPKRAGLTKGMRLTGHVHPEADKPSALDVPLVILDVFHGPLKDVYEQHDVAFLLDGIESLDEAVNILQGFSSKKITPESEVDYLTFTYSALFDALAETEQQRLLSLPTEEAVLDPAFSRLFYPTLCQTLVWHGYDLFGWIKFLENFDAIDHQKANLWRSFRFRESQSTYYPVEYMTSGMLQELLDEFDPQAGPDNDFRACVLGELDAYGYELPPARYLLTPCQKCGHHYLLEDTATGTQGRYLEEQEAEVLIAESESLPWDQTYAYDRNHQTTCPGCQIS